MSAPSAFTSHPIQSWTVAASGLSGFILAIWLGLIHAGVGDKYAIIIGTIMAITSGFFWYTAALIPLIAPDRIHASASANMLAAVSATAAACYLLPTSAG
jgi:hypothetical protein